MSTKLTPSTNDPSSTLNPTQPERQGGGAPVPVPVPVPVSPSVLVGQGAAIIADILGPLNLKGSRRR